VGRVVIDCCYGCEERHVGCHGSCERYREQRARKDAEIARVMAAKAGSYGKADSMRIQAPYRRKERKR